MKFYLAVALEPVLLGQPRLPVLPGRVEEDGSVVLGYLLPLEDVLDSLNRREEILFVCLSNIVR
jgi:hypothetical protein